MNLGGNGPEYSDPAAIRLQAANLVIFAVDSVDLPTELQNVDAGEPHRLIEPSKGMPLDDFQRLLAGTRDSWRRV
jgi:hypothetical protein